MLVVSKQARFLGVNGIDVIEFNCPHCGNSIKVSENVAGKSGACNKCGNTVYIPEVMSGIKDPVTPSSNFPVMIDREIQRPSNRIYLVLIYCVILFALLTSQSFPKLSMWFGWLLLALIAIYFIPILRAIPRRVMQINEDSIWQTKLKLIAIAISGVTLISASIVGSSRIAESVRLAEEKAEQEAERKSEQKRLTKKANERVVSAVKSAEIYWQYKNMAKVEETLDSASKIPNATNFKPIQELRTRIADSNIKSMVSEATEYIKEGNIERGRKVVLAALAVPHASDVTYVKKLDNHILNATDPKHNRDSLMELSDSEFQNLQKNGKLPNQLVSGYKELDSRIASLTNAHVKEIVAERKKREQERIEKERLAAIAAKEAAQKKKMMEIAVAKANQEKARIQRIERGFSSWDGSHRGLTRSIKEIMNDPSSYEHVKTVYWDRNDHLIVQTTFRGKNAFGALVINRMKAKVDLDGNVLKVIETEP